MPEAIQFVPAHVDMAVCWNFLNNSIKNAVHCVLQYLFDLFGFEPFFKLGKFWRQYSFIKLLANHWTNKYRIAFNILFSKELRRVSNSKTFWEDIFPEKNSKKFPKFFPFYTFFSGNFSAPNFTSFILSIAVWKEGTIAIGTVIPFRCVICSVLGERTKCVSDITAILKRVN